MSRIMLHHSRRLLSSLANNRSFCSTVPARESIISSSTTNFNNQNPVSSSSPPPPPSPPPASHSAQKKSPWRFLRYGVSTALLGTAATAGYVTYAYTVDQVDEMTQAFRDSANQPVDEDASSFQKFEALLHSATTKVPARCIDIYLDLRRRIEEQVRGFTEPISDIHLPDLHPQEQQARILTLVLDLNETLVYTDWKRERGWRTFKRPGVDAFLERLAQFYEIVVFSDQPDMYVGPILSRLDQKNCIRHTLTRSATTYTNGKHYRDLSKLNRDPSRVVYVSGHALETAFQPENCAPIKPWKLEEGDTALIDIIPFLEFLARENYTRPYPIDIRKVLSVYKDCDIATEFNNRQRKMLESQKPARSLWAR